MFVGTSELRLFMVIYRKIPKLTKLSDASDLVVYGTVLLYLGPRRTRSL